MQNPSPKSGAALTPSGQAPTSAVDMRCAIVLARVALQTLADLNPEAAASIDHALAHEIRAAQATETPDALAVIAILQDVRARLAGDDASHDMAEDSVWYIE